jgi:hypothetical protein
MARLLRALIQALLVGAAEWPTGLKTATQQFFTDDYKGFGT